MRGEGSVCAGLLLGPLPAPLGREGLPAAPRPRLLNEGRAGLAAGPARLGGVLGQEIGSQEGTAAREVGPPPHAACAPLQRAAPGRPSLWLRRCPQDQEETPSRELPAGRTVRPRGLSHLPGEPRGHGGPGAWSRPGIGRGWREWGPGLDAGSRPRVQRSPNPPASRPYSFRFPANPACCYPLSPRSTSTIPAGPPGRQPQSR